MAPGASSPVLCGSLLLLILVHQQRSLELLLPKGFTGAGQLNVSQLAGGQNDG